MKYAWAGIPELSGHQPLKFADFFVGKDLGEKLAQSVGILGKVLDQDDLLVFQGAYVRLP
jgi:hypothetical protein